MRKFLPRNPLVVVQIAFSLALLTAAGLAVSISAVSIGAVSTSPRTRASRSPPPASCSP